ncbi:MAG TPA: CoA-binding protein [Anaerolineae bacterium]|nr:CoA-binding protein [Anaerolineae bacterium]
MDPIQKILQESKTIAVVGLSNNPSRPSYEVAQYLQQRGYRIIPVNPNISQVLGEKAYPDLLSVPGPVDIVDIFRRPEYVPAVVQQAIAKNAKVVWMQPGTENYDAADAAEAAGLKAVVGMCLRVQHRRAESAHK